MPSVMEALALAESDWVIAGASVALVLVTAVLAIYTRTLGKVTRQLAATEDRRDRDLIRSRRLNQVSLKVDLAEKINSMSVGAFMPGAIKEMGAEFYRGPPAEHTAAWLRQLYRILDYDADGISKAHLERIFGVYDELAYGAQFSPDNVKDVFEKIQHIQAELKGVLPRWRNEIVELSVELVRPQGHLYSLVCSNRSTFQDRGIV